MDISNRKMALIQWLIELQDLKMIRHLEQLSSEEKAADHRISEEEWNGLEHALRQVENGEIISGEEVHSRLKAKYNL